jgi:hypothetical protein
MRKLRLNVEAIVVETFHTAAGAPAAGTIHGAQYAAYPHDSGASDCDICWSADPCTNIPVETCTCGCGPTEPITPPNPGPYPVPVNTGCNATSECTCTPIETCSCVPNY